MTSNTTLNPKSTYVLTKRFLSILTSVCLLWADPSENYTTKKKTSKCIEINISILTHSNWDPSWKDTVCFLSPAFLVQVSTDTFRWITSSRPVYRAVYHYLNDKVYRILIPKIYLVIYAVLMYLVLFDPVQGQTYDHPLVDDNTAYTLQRGNILQIPLLIRPTL